MHIGQGCRHGVPESPHLSNMAVGQAMGLAVEERAGRDVVIQTRAYESDPPERLQEQGGRVLGAYADGSRGRHLLCGENTREAIIAVKVTSQHRAFGPAKPQASMVFATVLLSRDTRAPPATEPSGHGRYLVW